MTLLRSLIALTLLASIMSTGCVKKAETTPIDGLELKKDDLRHFEIKVPSNWIIQTQKGDLVLATSKPGISRRFLDFGKGEGGAKVELRAITLDSTRTIDTLIKNSKLEFEDKLDRYKIESSTLGGKPAKKLFVKFDQEDGEYKSEAYFAENDNVVTIVTFAAFGNTFDEYANEFKDILASVKLARRPDAPKGPDTLAPTGPEPPSDTLRSYSAPDFTIQIPQNFEGKKSATGGMLSSVNFFGSRLDCNIQVDVFDASKQKNLEKILLQNKPSYGGKDPKGLTLSGAKSAYFSYDPSATVSSRAYFTVKGNKLFRITVNWYKPEQNVYLPIFEKCINSISLK
ncbi:MAG: hypothetical protein J5I53_07425 [Bradyrhizobiaceae bacterium]|nr:hypothetical protein [Bradyrhizobiaceae bacterium]